MALGASLVLHAGALALILDMPESWRPQMHGVSPGQALYVVALPAREKSQAKVPPPETGMANAGKAATTPQSGERSEAQQDVSAIPPPGHRDEEESTRGLGLVPYFPAKMLDERPKVIVDIPSELPELAKHPQGGMLTLTLKIGSTGDVDSVEVDTTTMPDVFAQETARAFYQAKFTQGRKNGVAVGTLLRIEVRYQPLAPPARGR
jgi:hypothetical protein